MCVTSSASSQSIRPCVILGSLLPFGGASRCRLQKTPLSVKEEEPATGEWKRKNPCAQTHRAPLCPRGVAWLPIQPPLTTVDRSPLLYTSKNLSRKHALFSPDVITVGNQTEDAAKEGSNSGSSSSMFHGANENKADWRIESGSCLSPRPDYQQKKARLLFMQEEVGFHSL
ncbi:uncharacterized protein DS421_20g698720 [Arachis hypogaea]|nr:uncharacterized protein DS421_20g698720 [Arachis hypogaea]